MKTGGSRFLGLLAIYAIALHTILWGAGIPYASASVDPFSVICHSEAAAPGEQAPAGPASSPSHACDHCNLCSAMAPPDPRADVVITRLVPARLLQVLRPASASTRDGIAAHLKRARGPPQAT
jgi:hypothetical protein